MRLILCSLILLLGISLKNSQASGFAVTGVPEFGESLNQYDFHFQFFPFDPQKYRISATRTSPDGKTREWDQIIPFKGAFVDRNLPEPGTYRYVFHRLAHSGELIDSFVVQITRPQDKDFSELDEKPRHRLGRVRMKGDIYTDGQSTFIQAVQLLSQGSKLRSFQAPGLEKDQKRSRWALLEIQGGGSFEFFGEDGIPGGKGTKYGTDGVPGGDLEPILIDILTVKGATPRFYFRAGQGGAAGPLGRKGPPGKMAPYCLKIQERKEGECNV